MSLVVLPAIRLSRVRERLQNDAGLGPNVTSQIMQIIEDELEVGARRVGSLCPRDGCRQMLQPGEGIHDRYSHCAVHGYIDSHGGLPLVIAFDPCTGMSRSADARRLR